MHEFQIPYGTGTLPLHVSEENLKAVLRPKLHQQEPLEDEAELVQRALAQPIGTPHLHELAKGKSSVVIVTSDHTRAMPSRITLPLLIGEIRRGNPAARITILIATGLHRATTEQEQRRMFGDEIVDRERIAVNNAFRKEDFVSLGTLPSGAELCVNRIAAECDLLVTEGFIEPHFFAGFSGGRKSVLPGICSEKTVNENHSFQAIASPYAKAGVLDGNPIHRDMVEAARRTKVQFILNVALDPQKRIAAAFAGDLEQAHAQGVHFIRSQYGCRAEHGDIVITSNGGYPLDQNLYQSPKAAATAEMCCREGGVIILCCSCSDGIGGEHFEKLIGLGSPEQIEAHLAALPPRETIPEQWCAQIYARILKRHSVILVTTGLSAQQVRRANMVPAASVDEALALAYTMVGKDAQVVVIPDGVNVLTEEKDVEQKIALRVNARDNVATIFANDVSDGTVVTLLDNGGSRDALTVIGDIPYGHKIAVRAIGQGEKIYKYSEEIGVACRMIKKGEYVHIHNLDSMRGRGDLAKSVKEEKQA